MNKFILWYILLNVSDELKFNLKDRFKSEENIFNNFDEIKRQISYLGIKFKDYNKYEALEVAKCFGDAIIKEGIGYITTEDEAYPDTLHNIDAKPFVLFYKGNIGLLKSEEKSVGIVGSRNCSTYGVRVTSMIAKELALNGIKVISGGARGIDSVAHRECVNNNGKTIVVLGSGVDVPYPYENKNLFKEVEKNGLIISEFLPGTAPKPYNFPRRNRIISGLSNALVVPEAAAKSGSLITVEYALNFGVPVFTVPGNIFSKESKGCNTLKSEGAHTFTDMEDIYLALKININKKKTVYKGVNSNILKVMGEEPIHIDEIINRSNIDREALYSILFDLQIKKEIISLPGNYYAKIS